MTSTQKAFLDNMTTRDARRLIAKFGSDPARAAARSEDAFAAFCYAWEFLYPGEYWQRANRAGGVDYRLVYRLVSVD